MIRTLWIFLCTAVVLAAADPRALALYGVMINTTEGVEAKARLVIAIRGEAVRGTLNMEAPLTGSGPVEGSFRNGWLELSGRLSQGISIQLRGGLNAMDYRGTYLVATSGAPVQYGRFQLAVESK